MNDFTQKHYLLLNVFINMGFRDINQTLVMSNLANYPDHLAIFAALLSLDYSNDADVLNVYFKQRSNDLKWINDILKCQYSKNERYFFMYNHDLSPDQLSVYILKKCIYILKTCEKKPEEEAQRNTSGRIDEARHALSFYKKEIIASIDINKPLSELMPKTHLFIQTFSKFEQLGIESLLSLISFEGLQQGNAVEAVCHTATSILEKLENLFYSPGNLQLCQKEAKTMTLINILDTRKSANIKPLAAIISHLESLSKFYIGRFSLFLSKTMDQHGIQCPVKLSIPVAGVIGQLCKETQGIDLIPPSPPKRYP